MYMFILNKYSKDLEIVYKALWKRLIGYNVDL